jgi:hypothetical protein
MHEVKAFSSASSKLFHFWAAVRVAPGSPLRAGSPPSVPLLGALVLRVIELPGRMKLA